MTGGYGPNRQVDIVDVFMVPDGKHCTSVQPLDERRFNHVTFSIGKAILACGGRRTNFGRFADDCVNNIQVMAGYVACQRWNF